MSGFSQNVKEWVWSPICWKIYDSKFKYNEIELWENEFYKKKIMDTISE